MDTMVSYSYSEVSTFGGHGDDFVLVVSPQHKSPGNQLQSEKILLAMPKLQVRPLLQYHAIAACRHGLLLSSGPVLLSRHSHCFHITGVHVYCDVTSQQMLHYFHIQVTGVLTIFSF